MYKNLPPLLSKLFFEIFPTTRFFPAHNQRKRLVGGERLVPRDPLVRATVRYRNQPDEIRRLRVWRRRSAILPRWRRVSHYTVHVEHSAESKVNIWKERNILESGRKEILPSIASFGIIRLAVRD